LPCREEKKGGKTMDHLTNRVVLKKKKTKSKRQANKEHNKMNIVILQAISRTFTRYSKNFYKQFQELVHGHFFLPTCHFSLPSAKTTYHFLHFSAKEKKY
jgi:hypothetical protein